MQVLLWAFGDRPPPRRARRARPWWSRRSRGRRDRARPARGRQRITASRDVTANASQRLHALGDRQPAPDIDRERLGELPPGDTLDVTHRQANRRTNVLRRLLPPLSQLLGRDLEVRPDSIE